MGVHKSNGKFSFRSFYWQQQEFSEGTFGPGNRTKGVCEHIRKELAELEEAVALGNRNAIIAEICDIIILAIDLAWRNGFRSSEIERGLMAKLRRNKSRIWPDWRKASRDKPIEHVRGTND